MCENFCYLLLCRNFIAVSDNPRPQRPLLTNSSVSTNSAAEMNVNDSFNIHLQLLTSQLLRYNEEVQFSMHIRRQYALCDALEILELVTADELFKPLNVVFMGESAVDNGGPTREFTSLIVLQCESSHLMEGM